MNRVKTRYVKLPYKVLACTTCYGECGQCGGSGHRVLTDRIPEHCDPAEFDREDCSKQSEETQGASILDVLDPIGIVLWLIGTGYILYKLSSP